MHTESDNKKYMLFVPGRLCMFGEHSDWAAEYKTDNPKIENGTALVACTKQGIYASVERSELLTINNAPQLAPDIRNFSSRPDCESLRRIAESDDFYSRAAGTALYMLLNYPVGGLLINVTKMDLPLKKGLSSSAMICVLIVRAYNLVYGLRLSVEQETKAAYCGERMTHSKCGRLDQICAYGEGVYSVEFNESGIQVEPLCIESRIPLIYTDIGKTKDTVKILSDLQSAYPFAQNQKEKNVHFALGSENRKTVSLAKKALLDNDLPLFGGLMQQAQQCFDENVAPMCPEQLRAPILHELLADAKIQKCTFGGKGVGSHGDGAAQFVAKSAQSRDEMIAYLEKHIGLHSYALDVSPHTVKKAIIPIAGMGTRMYPFTRSIRKELLPLVDGGKVKPAIIILLEQLYNSGIEEICLVVENSEHAQYYQNYFTKALPQKQLDAMSDEDRAYEQKLYDIGKRITYCIQKQHNGFGGAVLCAREFADDQPVLVLLGDTLYRSYIPVTCSTQLISAFESAKKTTVAIARVELSRVNLFGIVTGSWSEAQPYIMGIADTVEKPTPEFAEQHLEVKGKNREGYYSYMGQYIITDEVFDELQGLIDNKAPNEETSLTEALQPLCKKKRLNGLAVQGDWFDLGNPETYRESLSRF